MAHMFRTRPPAWFWVVAIALLAWEAMGIWSWWQHWRYGAAAMGQTPTDYDIRYYAALPGWYVWLYGAAVWLGLAGGILLLMRRAAARPVAIAALIATLLMFGYVFLATDLIRAKGVWTTYFPLAIVAIGFGTVWFIGRARRRGWLR